MKNISILCCLLIGQLLVASADTFYYDCAHGEREPNETIKMLVRELELDFCERKTEICPESLVGCKVLYLQAPATKLGVDEQTTIIEFVNSGGAMFLVLDEEVRQSLQETEVNNLIIPFGMMLTVDTPYLHNQGGMGQKGEILRADYELPYSGGRAVAGGTAFAYRLDKHGNAELPFASYKKLDSGGRIVVMGEGMPSIFLGTKEGKRLTGVDRDFRRTTYFGKDSLPFMRDILFWLSRYQPNL